MSQNPPTSTFDPDRTLAVAEALEMTLKTDGWKYIKAWIEGQRREAMGHMLSSADPIVLARTSGTLAAFQAFEQWAEMNAKNMRATVDRYLERGKQK